MERKPFGAPRPLSGEVEREALGGCGAESGGGADVGQEF
jgi:hypothetical protein